MSKDNKKIRINRSNKSIKQVDIDFNLNDDISEIICDDPVEWETVLNSPPLNRFSTAQRLYIDLIINFSKFRNLPVDKFYVHYFRFDECNIDILKYFITNKYSLNTAELFISHFIVVIKTCPHHFLKKDFVRFKQFEVSLKNLDIFKVSEHSKVKILPWEQMIKKIEVNILLDKRPYIKTLGYFLSRGYVLRIAVFCETRIIKDDKERALIDEDCPSLNINTGHFFIPVQKSNGSSFFVDKETLTVYKNKYYNENDVYLLNITNQKVIKPVTKPSIASVFYNVIATSRIRKSYLTYYIMEKAETMAQIDNITRLVGNLPDTCFEKYLQIDKSLLSDNKQIIAEHFAEIALQRSIDKDNKYKLDEDCFTDSEEEN